MNCKICGKECKAVDQLCEPCNNFNNHWTDLKMRYPREAYEYMKEQLRKLKIIIDAPIVEYYDKDKLESQIKANKFLKEIEDLSRKALVGLRKKDVKAILVETIKSNYCLLANITYKPNINLTMLGHRIIFINDKEFKKLELREVGWKVKVLLNKDNDPKPIGPPNQEIKEGEIKVVQQKDPIYNKVEFSGRFRFDDGITYNEIHKIVIYELAQPNMKLEFTMSSSSLDYLRIIVGPDNNRIAGLYRTPNRGYLFGYDVIINNKLNFGTVSVKRITNEDKTNPYMSSYDDK